MPNRLTRLYVDINLLFENNIPVCYHIQSCADNKHYNTSTVDFYFK